jgi:hypothetical protein
MTRSAALLILPSRPPPDATKDAPQDPTPLLMQSLEDLRRAERVAPALHATGYGPLRHIEVNPRDLQLPHLNPLRLLRAKRVYKEEMELCWCLHDVPERKSRSRATSA